MGLGWRIIEEPSYSDALEGFTDQAQIDAVLAPIDYALNRNPLGFVLMPGYDHIRMVKTRLRINQGSVIPAMRLWFRCDEPNRIVYKLYIELSPPDDMFIGDPFGEDDDEIPF